MSDVIFVAVVLAFFGLCIAYCGWCDRIIGPDPLMESEDGPADAPGGGA